MPPPQYRQEPQAMPAYDDRPPLAGGPNESRLNAEDRTALAKYRYMIRTAPPEDVERAHAEAFAALTPDQRRAVLQEMANDPYSERPRSDDPYDLARTATRNEYRRPGYMERTFGGGMMGAYPGGGMMGGGLFGGGGMMGGGFMQSMMGSIIGTVIASAIANHFFNNARNAMGFDHFLNNGGGDVPLGQPVDVPLVDGMGNDLFGSPDADWVSGDPMGDPGLNDGGFLDPNGVFGAPDANWSSGDPLGDPGDMVGSDLFGSPGADWSSGDPMGDPGDVGGFDFGGGDVGGDSGGWDSGDPMGDPG